MRYTLLLNNAEPAEGEIDPDAITAMQAAFGAYGRALQAAGVLVAAEVLASTRSTTTVTIRSGDLQIQDGPFAETKEALAGVFVIDVPDLDAALMWAEQCPGAQYGVVEVRAAATSFIDGSWT
ncbi:YciI family protein [Rhodococcus sp. G-MC3]|uniref:YciI family protein n=1 Tax=Rhodococcus sp. G-MC3 TaxID=3046209 RepID=UPI0024BB5429|nr:YciI family protein [Rhodococcus sp. G-MC3]MDJ0393661.1 YciI family protein [Rhodococcus sp. G-MC3]